MGSYRERLFAPVSYWLLAIPVVVLLGAEAVFVAGGIVPPRGCRRQSTLRFAIWGSAAS